MKKKIIVIISIIAVVLMFLYFKYIFGWMTFIGNKDTPDKYLSHIIVKKDKYIKDSLKISKQLKYFLEHHQYSFHNKNYYSGTQLSLDTILYSPDFNKLALFVIAKNPESRRLLPDEKYEWHYDGYCYFGTRLKDSIDLIYLDAGFGSHYKDHVSEWLRTNYFRLFATIKDVNEQYKYKYNLNDTRFWNGPLWKEIDDIRQQEREFEKIKREHPENVYEPKE